MQAPAHSFREAIAQIQGIQRDIDQAYDACDTAELPPTIYRNTVVLKRLIAAAAVLPIRNAADASRALELIVDQLAEPHASLAQAIISYLSDPAVP